MTVRSHKALSVILRGLTFSKKPMWSHLNAEACYNQICILQRFHWYYMEGEQKRRDVGSETQK